MTTPGSSAPDNRRQAPRRRSFLRGKIVYDDGGHSVDCTIRDVSATGARVSLPDGQGVPKQFFLLDMKNRVAHEVEVRWRAGAEIGVQSLRSFSLDTELPREFRFLQRLWSGSFAGFYPDAGPVPDAPSRTASRSVRLFETTPAAMPR